MRHNPFQTSGRQQAATIVPIGTQETGIIYLERKMGIAPVENPVDMAEAMQRQTETTLIFLQAVKNCATKEGISQAAARKKIFPEPKKPELPATPVNGNGALVKVEVMDEEEVDLYDYLEPEQVVKLIGLRENSREIELQAATLFIQHRLAYPIVLRSEAQPGAELIEIEPLRFQVAVGNKFRFGSVILEATGAAGYDEATLTVKSVPLLLSAGSAGFLLDVTGREKLGDPEWTIEDTRRYLLEAQIQEIFHFYEQETGLATKKDDDAPEGNLTKTLPASPTISTESQSTGEQSIGESKVLA
jgi:hypothetical protein